jgi:hypothetical protein
MDDREIDRKQREREVEQVQREHEAAQERDRRHRRALEEQEASKQGQRVWIIPEFDAGYAESEYLIETARDALPEYNCQLAHAPELTEREIYELMNRNTPLDDDQG